MKHRFPFHGLPKPIRAEIQRPFVAEWKAMEIEWIHKLAERLWQLPEREYQYTAMDLLMAAKRKWTPESLHHFEAMISERSWWDSVDAIASRMVGGLIGLNPAKHRRRVIGYAKSEDLWLNRTALIHQLFYKDKTDAGLFEEVFMCCGHKTDFFHPEGCRVGAEAVQCDGSGLCRGFCRAPRAEGISATRGIAEDPWLTCAG